MKKITNTISQSIIDLNTKIDSIQKKIEIRGEEIDLIQTHIYRNKKWWKETSNMISIIALLLSLFASVYSIKRDNKKEIETKEQRIKEIVERLTEIQIQIANSGENYSKVDQITFSETSNLVDEAIEISNNNLVHINDSEYNTIIAMAHQTHKNVQLIKLIEKALKIVDDGPTEYGIRNYQASYYYAIELNPEKGREIMRNQVFNIKTQKISEHDRTFTLAQLYLMWCRYEFNINEIEKGDSLLKIAEELVILTPDSSIYSRYPLIKVLNNQREMLNKELNTLPNPR